MEAVGSNWPARLSGIANEYQKSIACAISFVVLLALHQAFGVTEFPFDSAEYWDLAKPSMFGNYPTHRGYVFPALLLPLRFLCDMSNDAALVFRLGMSLAYGIALPLLVPAAFQEAFGGKVTLIRRLVPVFLLALLFPGVLVYALSDLPALLMVLAALCLALRGVRQAEAGSFLAMFGAAGFAIGAAYNTRPIYLVIPVGSLALLALLTLHAGFKLHSRWLGIAAAVAGMFLVSLPQLVINQRTHGIPSLAVQARVGNHSLFASQLVWGMTLQRYETTIRPDAPAATVFYLDPDGEQLFNEVAGRGDLFALPYYLTVVAQHPVHFLSLFTRHAINGLDVRDGNVYTRKPSPLRTRTALLNFSVLALACWVAWSLRNRSVHVPQDLGAAPPTWRWSLLILLLPVLAILPGAVETRFFLPLHLLAYCVIAFYFDAARMKASLRKHWTTIVFVGAIAAGVFFAVSSSTMAQLHYSWPEAYRHGLPSN